MEDPLLLSFARLQRLIPRYFARKWPGRPTLGEFMQAGQGWGHRLADEKDIRQLADAFFSARASQLDLSRSAAQRARARFCP